MVLLPVAIKLGNCLADVSFHKVTVSVLSKHAYELINEIVHYVCISITQVWHLWAPVKQYWVEDLALIFAKAALTAVYSVPLLCYAPALHADIPQPMRHCPHPTNGIMLQLDQMQMLSSQIIWALIMSLVQFK